MKELKFVDVGEGITEGHIVKWLFNNGDAVKEDQAVVQIETDKAVVSIPAPISGTIKIAAKEGTDVKVGDMLAYIGSAEELSSVSASQPPQQAAQPQATAVQQAQAPKPEEQAGEILATPSVRKLARELGIDLGNVSGTGPHGRIMETDLKGAPGKPAASAQASQQQQLQPQQLQKPRQGATSFSEAQASMLKGIEAKHGEDVERVPLSQTRKAIARNMELSWTMPRAVHMDLIDATVLASMVEKEKPNAQKLGVKLTFLPFIIKATVEALKESPRFNSSYDPEKQEILVKKYYNIGLAAESEDGLKVVVIKNADKKSIIELAKEIEDLHKKILDKTISIDEMRDSSFTITNIGSLGGGFLSVPMINYPDVAILGIHLIRPMPIVEGGEIKVGKVLPFSISFDHRVVDGAEAVKFGNALIKYLEDPDFLEMIG